MLSPYHYGKIKSSEHFSHATLDKSVGSTWILVAMSSPAHTCNPQPKKVANYSPKPQGLFSLFIHSWLKTLTNLAQAD